MNRITIFAILATGSIAGLFGTWYYFLTLSSAMHGSMPAMQSIMDMMMGGAMTPAGMPFASFLIVIPLAFIAILVVGVVGLGYSVLFPEIRRVRSIQPEQAEQNLSAIMKTLNEDEQKVMQVLLMHNGKYLQKYIVKESGLTRLKVHRILARLTERGVVTIREYANTNDVSLAGWLQKEK